MSQELDLLKIVADRTKKDGLSLVENKEILERVGMGYAVLRALQNSCFAVKELGEDGKKVEDAGGDFVNQHVVADSASEAVMRDQIDRWGKITGYKAKIWGEEIGKKVEVGNLDSKKISRWFIDGLDGTANYRKPEKWPYGPMIVGVRSKNPKYEDFEVAGIGNPEENIAVLGMKDIGVFFVDFEKETISLVDSFDSKEEFDINLILADDYYEPIKKVLGDYLRSIWSRTGSTAASIMAILLGSVYESKKYPETSKDWLGLIESTGKDNLERACYFLLISFLGGVVTDIDGNSIGPKVFMEWAQKDEEGKYINIPIIVAKNKQIHKEMLALLNRN